jgi:aminopeptidase N/puromycin-sensitive aminopeptidase
VPILTFSEPKNGQVSVGQRRFFLSPSVQPDLRQKWTLPVCFKNSDGTADCRLLTPRSTTLKVLAGAVFFANAGGKGYYRSAYPPAVYSALIAKIETALTPVERISLAGDEWAQVRSNKAPVGDYLDMAAALKGDASSEVVSTPLGGVGAIFERLAATKEEKNALAAWLRRTYSPELAKLGMPSPSDTPNTNKLRALLFGMLGYYGDDPAVLKQAEQIAERYLADPLAVDPTLGQTALSIAAEHGDAQLYDALQKLYETSTDPVQKTTALNLLAQFENPELVRRSLEYATSDKVRNQDAAIQLSVSLRTPASRDQAWSYIKSNWDKVQAQLTTEMGGYLVSSTGSFCSAEMRDDVQSFFATHKVAATDRALKQAVERINGCIEFRNLQEPNLKKWLAAQPSQ